MINTQIIKLSDYGAIPNSQQDLVPILKQAINDIKKIKGHKVIQFIEGTYNLFPEYAHKQPYYISNTTSEEEKFDVTKTIGILLKNIDNLTIEGNGALLLYRGKMTQLVVDNCSDIEFKDLNFDYKHPTVFETKVCQIHKRYIDVEVHDDSRYVINRGKLQWIGEGFTSEGSLCVEYNPTIDKCWRTWNPITTANFVKEIAHNRLRLYYLSKKIPKKVTVNNIYQFRESIRDQVGVFINRSKNITFNKVGMNFTHGLGVIGQYSEDLTFNEVKWKPRRETKRTCAAFADFLHISGCRGMLSVNDCEFAGAHDDCINVHGTHLRIIKIFDDLKIKVRFMHHQSYGFDAFTKGDMIEFINSKTLLPYDKAEVLNTTRVNNRDIILTLSNIPKKIDKNDVVENTSWVPKVTIKGNKFGRIPTRGILLTTRGKILVEDNTFNNTTMSAILVADDANSWYESGYVTNLTIKNNTFNECASPIINIEPENTRYDKNNPVHKGICIEENTFINKDESIEVYAKSTADLTIKNNTAKLKAFDIKLKSCDNVIVFNNN